MWKLRLETTGRNYLLEIESLINNLGVQLGVLLLCMYSSVF